MYIGSSNAKVITEREFDRKNKITFTNCAHKRNMLKQKLCGIMVIAVVMFAVLFAEDMELVLGLIPVGTFLIMTKRTILTIENE